MFSHIFKNRFKCIIRDKQTLLWTFLFPIILGTLFKIAIPDESTTQKFNTINIAIVNNDSFKNNDNFKTALDSATKSSSNSDKLFNIDVTSKEEAENLLKDNKIKGYILISDKDIGLYVKENGIDQTITREFINSYMQTYSQHVSIFKYNPNSQTEILKQNEENNYITEKSITSQQENSSLNYYYALIAMACLYGGFMGSKEVMNVEADQTLQGARINVSPINKLKLFTYSIFTATFVQIILTSILLVYLKFILNIDFGNKIAYVLLAVIASCFTGVSFGGVVAAIVKGKEGIKISFLIAISMIMSFLSGLMVADMKYIIQKNIPILSYINPANLISDSFYSLYYYDTYTRYFTNIGLLFLMSFVFYFITFFIMRRQKYASI